MIFTNMYTRECSRIDNNKNVKNQSVCKIIKYDLCTVELESSQKIYGIRIEAYFDLSKKESIIENVSNDKNFVIMIIKYLYENCIDDICLKDIVHDLMFEFKSKERKYY